MPWNQNSGGGGGGPWGQGGGGGSGGGGGPWGQRGGGGGGPQPPNLEDIIRQGQDKLKSILPKGGGGGGGIGAIGLVAIAALGIGVWGANGLYRVQPDEVGVELVFGKFNETTQPGLRFNWPSPIGEVAKPTILRENRVDIGFRATNDTRRTGQENDESLMLTGDENIVDIDFTVLWRINDPLAYLFNIQDPDNTVKVVAESAMREVIGQSSFQFAVTEGRQEIEEKVRQLMQETLDSYGPADREGGAGVRINQVQLQKVDPPREVIDAFRDVQAARADQERLANQAEAYRNKIVPEARGEAERVRQAAQGYKEQVIAEATGEAERFKSVYAEYSKARQVSRERMYIDTMEKVLGGMNKLIMDGNNGPGVTPYLPLPDLARSMERKSQGEVK